MINMKMYLVGGAVRDELLGKTPKDKDYCVTGLTFDEAHSKFGEPLGEFPVFMDLVDGELSEIALARKDVKKDGEEGHKAFDVMFDEHTTIEEDLFRRDFTVNAMAKDLETGEVIDPYGGEKDIKAMVIRCVNPDVFSDDPLRVLRMARFATKLEFGIESETMRLAEGIDITSLPKERIWKEFEKVLEYKHAYRFFEVLRDTGHLKVILPELEKQYGLEQAYHEEDVWNHTLWSTNFDLTREERFAMLMHDMGKGFTPQDILPHHYQHERRGKKVVEIICERLGVPNKYKKLAVWFTRNHMTLHMVEDMKRNKLTKLVENLMSNNILPEQAIKLAKCDAYARSDPQEISYMRLRKAYKLIDTISAVAILERGFSGPKVGELLHEERVRVLHANKI